MNSDTASMNATQKKSFIALTGATGFIGTTLLPHLIRAGWNVRALYRPKKGMTPPNISGVEWIEGSLNDEDALDKLVLGTHTIIHCAGAVRGASQADFDKVNKDGALNIASAAVRQKEIPHLLLISSLAAREPELSHYAGSKRRGETAIKSVSKDLRWTILRPPAVFGPGDKELLPLFQCIAKGFAPLPANTNSRFSMIYVDDLASAIVSLLQVNTGFEQTFELDDGRKGGYDWDTVLKIGSQILHKGVSVRRIAVPIFLLKSVAWVNLVAAKLLGYSPMLTPGKIRELTHSDWSSDNQQFSQLTGWQPSYDLAKGLTSIFKQKIN